MSRNYQYVSGLVAVLLFSLGGHDVRADVSVTIHGTIVEPVCSVTAADGSSRTEVDFKNVPVEALGSAQAQQPLQMRVVCANTAPNGKTLQMYVKPVSNGTMTVGSQSVLGTSMTGLGIALDHNGSPVAPDTWVPVNEVDTTTAAPTGNVTLQASLVSADVSKLAAGSFTASAYILMTYQ